MHCFPVCLPNKNMTPFLHIYSKYLNSGFPDSSVDNLPAMQETPVQFLGPEDLLEEG